MFVKKAKIALQFLVSIAIIACIVLGTAITIGVLLLGPVFWIACLVGGALAGVGLKNRVFRTKVVAIIAGFLILAKIFSFVFVEDLPVLHLIDFGVGMVVFLSAVFFLKSKNN